MNETQLAIAERIGVALLHSLWQGALVGLVLLVALVGLRRASAPSRYLACWLALVSMLLLPLTTFLATSSNRPSSNDVDRRPTLVSTAAAALETAARLVPLELDGLPATTNDSGTSPTPIEATSAAAAGQGWLSPRARTLLVGGVSAWGVGVVLLSIRMLGGYLLAWRLTRRFVQPLDEIWQERFRRLAERLGVRVPVEIWQSGCVDVPAVIGCFRPVVLVPVAAITGLPTAQLEAILAHELAHIRRYDFLANAVQCAVETLLFYHPCVWWVSSRLRAEREHCCDELAVAACGDALDYARALADLDQWRTPARLALAFTGGGPLLARVRRIVGVHRASDVVGGWLAGILAIAVPLAVGGTWAWSRTVAGTPNTEKREAAERRAVSEDVQATDHAAAPGNQQQADELFDEMPLRLTALPPQPFGGHDMVARMVEDQGPEFVVKVVVLGLRGDVYQQVYDRLRGTLPNLSHFGSGRGDTAVVHLAPVSDLDYFASRIDLGQVQSIDREQRVITVVADPARLAQTAPPAIEDDGLDLDDIPSLCEQMAARDRRAIDRLIELGSAAELEVNKYVGDADHRVRRAALVVLKQIATEHSLPQLLTALADTDVGNRDLAWQAIGRLPGVPQRPEAIEAAMAALDRDPEEAAKWLTAIGSAAEPALLERISASQPRQRLAIIQVLRTIGTPACLPALERIAADPASTQAIAAAAARDAVVRRWP